MEEVLIGKHGAIVYDPPSVTQVRILVDCPSCGAENYHGLGHKRDMEKHQNTMRACRRCPCSYQLDVIAANNYKYIKDE